MQLFENTRSEISEILKKSRSNSTRTFSARDLFKESFEKSLNADFTGESLVNIPDINILEYSDPKLLIKVNTDPLEALYGKNLRSFKNVSIGSHPDFEHIEINQYCYYHCTSMFVDIKGSTRLSAKYSLMEIRQIKDTLLSTVIKLVNYFGGHVQRLQGDGVMVHFVRVGQNPLDSIINALNASSVLCYFVENELSKVFEENNVKPLRIRIGIDHGKDTEVIWSHYGVEKCTELTTTSLHTDLAAKLQQRAPSNGILIGENIVNLLSLADEFYNVFNLVNSDGSKSPMLYIFDSSYKMYQFNWVKYLLSHPNFIKHSDGKNLDIQLNIKYSIKAEIAEPNTTNYIMYYPNSFSIPKGYSIKYTLLENGLPYTLKPHSKILWNAENRGLEAERANMQTHDFGKVNDNKPICETRAAYLGHHYLKCKIENSFFDNVNLKFPIYVQ